MEDFQNRSKLNIDCRKQCEFFEFVENHENESILIFHSCSSNLNVDKGENCYTNCEEMHVGNTPRSIMTKGTSTRPRSRSVYKNFNPGNNDKLMISYRREPSHDYTMEGVCGILFEGEIHFFGGSDYEIDLSRQHFAIETVRNGQLVKMTKKEDLELDFNNPSCSSFEMTSDFFPWFTTNVVILCFGDRWRGKSCYSFDDKLTYIGDSNHGHNGGGLTKYKEGLLTVGGYNQKTEILKMDKNKIFSWAVVEIDFNDNPRFYIRDHSLVTVETFDINEEYVLLIGGKDNLLNQMKNVFKFNGTWFSFGQLNKPRCRHNSIYWNGAVYVIGGIYNHHNNHITKTEIWNITDSPHQFKTKENFPDLLRWDDPHLFIVPDSFFPDY